MSAGFACKITEWILQWRSVSPQNDVEFGQALSKVAYSYNSKNDREAIIQTKLHKKLGGQIEVETPVGYIDLLTDSELIEIKHVDNWKHAVGQLICYGNYYDEHRKRLHLFGHKPSQNFTEITMICNKNDITVSMEN